MHSTRLSPEFRAALRARHGGREHAFDALTPKSTALLVIDMQNAFVAPGAPLEVPLARGIVPNINRLAAAMRALGGLVVWVRCTFTPTGRGRWATYFENFSRADPEAARASMYAGSEGHRFWPALDIRAGEPIVDKDRFSAFIQGASNLEALLIERGVDTVVITGTVTNVCCESTARDAMMRDFRVVMVEDANAARTDEEHLAGLMTVARVFGDVMSTDAVLAKLGTSPIS
jgi:ureidoacrylate peracid hydrolase